MGCDREPLSGRKKTHDGAREVEGWRPEQAAANKGMLQEARLPGSPWVQRMGGRIS